MVNPVTPNLKAFWLRGKPSFTSIVNNRSQCQGVNYNTNKTKIILIYEYTNKDKLLKNCHPESYLAGWEI